MLSYDAGIVSPERSVEIDRQAFGIGEEMLMIYSRNVPTVSLGRFSRIDSIDADYVRANGISVVRRISGGSPIYSDEGQLTITYVSSRRYFSDKEASYEFFGKRISEALSVLGIDAKYEPLNDIVIDDRKISGSAQYRNKDTVLMHGSLILRKGKHFQCIKEQKRPVTSIEDECGSVPKRRDILDALVESFRD